MSLIPFVITKNFMVLEDGESPILLIKAGGVNVPLHLNTCEANTIMAQWVNGELIDSSPYYLLGKMFSLFDISLTRIAITEIRNGNPITYLFLRREDEDIALLVHYGVAISLATAFDVPMLIEERVVIDATKSKGTQQFLSDIETLNPEVLES